MISLRKFLEPSGQGREEILGRIVNLLLQGIELHSVEGDAADYQQFRTRTSSLAERVLKEKQPQERLVAAAGVLESLREYNLRTTRLIRAQSIEFQNVFAMLRETLVEVSKVSQSSVSRLQDIEKKYEKASDITDVRSLKALLGDCLGSIRKEAETQRAESLQTIGTLAERFERSKERFQKCSADTMPDPVTQFPAASAAMAVINEASLEGEQFEVVVIVVQRLQRVNERFGQEVGDQVLQAVARHLREHISPEQLFRWRGPAFLAILRREQESEGARVDVKRAAAFQSELELQTGNRSILLPVSTNWVLLPPQPSAESLLQKIDKFVASHEVK